MSNKKENTGDGWSWEKLGEKITSTGKKCIKAVVSAINASGKSLAQYEQRKLEVHKNIAEAPVIAYNQLKAGNQQKKDIEGKKIRNKYTGKPIDGKEHADNYAHTLADAKIAQKGVLPAFAALAAGVGKEVYDIGSKTLDGQNIKEVLADSSKDMKNNIRGLRWGLDHPNEDPEKYFAQLNLKTNEIVPNYDNGIPKLDGSDSYEVRMQMKKDHQDAYKKILAAKSSARIKKAGRNAPQTVSGYKKEKTPSTKKMKRKDTPSYQPETFKQNNEWWQNNLNKLLKQEDR